MTLNKKKWMTTAIILTALIGVVILSIQSWLSVRKAFDELNLNQIPIMDQASTLSLEISQLRTEIFRYANFYEPSSFRIHDHLQGAEEALSWIEGQTISSHQSTQLRTLSTTLNQFKRMLTLMEFHMKKKDTIQIPITANILSGISTTLQTLSGNLRKALWEETRHSNDNSQKTLLRNNALLSGISLIVVITLYCSILIYNRSLQKQVAHRTLELQKRVQEHKKAEDEAKKALKFAATQHKKAMVGQIAGKMSHDFNNILGIIMGHAQLAMMDCQDPKLKQKLELIYHQTLRGKNLTKNLVAFAKDQEPKQEFFDIRDKLDLVVTLLEKDMEGIELIRKNEKNLPKLLADPGMIEHAFVNLLQNAIHATGKTDNPKITLTTHRRNEDICIDIEDNGCGIPEAYIGNIFDPSFTLKGSKDVTGSYQSDVKGTGYGMANVKKYVEQHHGSIAVASETGVGTKITICLPVKQKELTAEEKRELENLPFQTDKKILIVEDESLISDILYTILTQAPFCHRVDIAGNGDEAVTFLSDNRYDLISLDYILPGNMNGMDIYHHIRKKDDTVPVLFVSGNIEFLESIKALKENDPHVGHISKPCQNIKYVTCVHRLLNGINGVG